MRAVQNQYMGNEQQIREATIEVEIGANKRPISVPLEGVPVSNSLVAKAKAMEEAKEQKKMSGWQKFTSTISGWCSKDSDKDRKQESNGEQIRAPVVNNP